MNIQQPSSRRVQASHSRGFVFLNSLKQIWQSFQQVCSQRFHGEAVSLFYSFSCRRHSCHLPSYQTAVIKKGAHSEFRDSKERERAMYESAAKHHVQKTCHKSRVRLHIQHIPAFQTQRCFFLLMTPKTVVTTPNHHHHLHSCYTTMENQLPSTVRMEAKHLDKPNVICGFLLVCCQVC